MAGMEWWKAPECERIAVFECGGCEKLHITLGGLDGKAVAHIRMDIDEARRVAAAVAGYLDRHGRDMPGLTFLGGPNTKKLPIKTLVGCPGIQFVVLQDREAVMDMARAVVITTPRGFEATKAWHTAKPAEGKQ